jgi:mannose-1-phosphate guanylyltransferase
VVLHGATGWSDPGTLYALKEAINPDTTENVERGLVKIIASQDCLLYNYEDKKLLAVAGLEGMIVVNTEDAILVVHKDDVRLVKELVNSLIGTELEKYS